MRDSLCSEFRDGGSDSGRGAGVRLGQCRDGLRRALRVVASLARGIHDVATVRLLTGSNGTKSVCFTCCKSVRDPVGFQDGNVDCVLAAFLGRERGIAQHVVGLDDPNGMPD